VRTPGARRAAFTLAASGESASTGSSRSAIEAPGVDYRFLISRGTAALPAAAFTPAAAAVDLMPGSSRSLSACDTCGSAVVTGGASLVRRLRRASARPLSCWTRRTATWLVALSSSTPRTAWTSRTTSVNGPSRTGMTQSCASCCVVTRESTRCRRRGSVFPGRRPADTVVSGVAVKTSTACVNGSGSRRTASVPLIVCPSTVRRRRDCSAPPSSNWLGSAPRATVLATTDTLPRGMACLARHSRRAATGDRDVPHKSSLLRSGRPSSDRS
jgi:hypothetical protein